MTVPHQSEAPVRGRTGFSKIGGLLASVPSVSCPNFRAASLQKIVRSSSVEQERLLRRLLLLRFDVSVILNGFDKTLFHGFLLKETDIMFSHGTFATVTVITF